MCLQDGCSLRRCWREEPLTHGWGRMWNFYVMTYQASSQPFSEGEGQDLFRALFNDGITIGLVSLIRVIKKGKATF